MNTLFCTKCGTKLNENSCFCHKCGAAVHKSQESAPAPVVMPEPEPAPIPEPVVVPQPEPAPIPEPVVVPQPEPAPIPEPVVVPQAKPAPIPEPVVAPQPKPVPIPTPAVKPQPPAPTKKKGKQNSATRKGGSSVLAALLSLLIFICSFASILIINIQSATTKANLKDTIQNVILDIDLTQIPATELIANADSDLSMAEWIADEVEKNYIVPVHVDDDDVQDFLEDSTIPEFLSEKLSEYMNDIYEGNRGTGITDSELERLLWKNQKEIEELVGIPLTQTDVNVVLEKADADGLLDALRAKTLKNSSPAAYNAIHYGISTGAVIVLCAITLLCIILLAKVNRWNILCTCGDVGVVLAFIGGFYVILTILATILSGVWYAMVGTIIGSLTANILVNSLSTTCIVCVLSVALIAANVIGNKIINRKKANTAA